MRREVLTGTRRVPAKRRRLRRSAWIAVGVVGLCFWIPALVKAKLGATGLALKAAVSATAEAEGQQSSDGASPTARAAPAPICSPTCCAANCRAAVAIRPLVLTTTIVGKTRRAAIVNGRLYREGDRIVAGSELYRLAAVAEDRIELVMLGSGGGTKRSVALKPAAESGRDPSR